MELLSPVGTMEALHAAVQNGADAVYLGGKQFSARAYAQNFDAAELQEVIRYAHLYGVKVYVAVNTLIDNAEFPEYLEYLYFLRRINVDAVIFQDAGAIFAARRLLPDLELHASTQLSTANSAAARFLEKLGVSRAILAREVSLENIQRMGPAAPGIALEVFVHGALCVCYSGHCLMSSMIGGRSGNRGRCAQPCRLPYTLLDGQGKEVTAGHLLSPRDLKMIAHLPELQEAGAVSLKIEGRMKRPEYVAVVTHNYRRALDLPGRRLESEFGLQAEKELAQIFNRDFTTGYFLEKPGAHLMSYQRPNNRGLYIGRVASYNPQTAEVTVHLEESLRGGDGYEIWVKKGGRIAGEIGSLKQNGREVDKAEAGQASFAIEKGRPQTGDRVFKILDAELMERARTSFSFKEERKLPLKMRLKARIGQPLCLSVTDERGYTAGISGENPVQKAQKHPLTREIAEKQLGRLGNTVFSLAALVLDSDDEAMVPVSELNNLRREAIEELEAKILNAHARPFLSAEAYQKKVKNLLSGMTGAAPQRKKEVRLSVLVGDMASLQAAAEAGADIIYFGGEALRSKKALCPDQFSEAVEICRKSGAEAVLLLPRLFHEDKTEEIKRICEAGLKARAGGFLAGSPGSLQLALEMGLPGVCGDYPLNIFNDYTIQALGELGLKQVTLSPELTLEQLSGLKYPAGMRIEILVHGSLPLMITEHCTVGANLGQGHQEKGCPRPCQKGGYGLKDRMNMVFPLECDEYCRMLVYNPKTLSMLDRLPELLGARPDILRIEARKEKASWVRAVTALYRAEIDRILSADGAGRKPAPVDAARLEELKRLSPVGFTTGHYYRGVL
ncbi:MAG: DUF3656 domain-containing protein [Clostridia bacterium]|jgi:putative protease|nr:DUF3656 domain-containing protein [Clostridia bacterium]